MLNWHVNNLAHIYCQVLKTLLCFLFSFVDTRNTCLLGTQKIDQITQPFLLFSFTSNETKKRKRNGAV